MTILISINQTIFRYCLKKKRTKNNRKKFCILKSVNRKEATLAITLQRDLKRANITSRKNRNLTGKSAVTNDRIMSQCQWMLQQR